MAKQRFKAEEIIMKMREVEVHQGKGMDLISACKQAGITDVTIEEIEEFLKFVYHESYRLKYRWPPVNVIFTSQRFLSGSSTSWFLQKNSMRFDKFV